MKTWTTKGGNRIPIRNLTDDHLKNILRMGQAIGVEVARETRRTLEKFSLDVCGEQGVELVERALDREDGKTWRDYAPEGFGVLEDEALRRGLNWNDPVEIATKIREERARAAGVTK